MKTQNQITEMLKSARIAGYANTWQERRIYINLSSKDTGFAGDRSYQLYFDLFTDSLVSKAGKGTLSSQFKSDIKKVESLFNQ